MLSKLVYLSDGDGLWRPRLMFFVPDADLKAWGAGFRGPPVVGMEHRTERSRYSWFEWIGGRTGTPAHASGASEGSEVSGCI